jgi:HD-GYP domain-containing protein (c-di-GMP phosphodiesterase class II)
MPERVESKLKEENIINRQFVVDQFRELGVEIEKNEDLLERLTELKEDGHFDDAAKMAKIMDIIPSLSEEGKRNLKIAALVHDIGKTGKVNANKEERELIRTIFRHKKFNDSVNTKARDAINKELENDPLKNEIINYLEKEGVNIDSEKRTMKELWRDHVDDTYEILKALSHTQINSEIINIAASHHYLEGRNPVGLKDEEISKEIQIFGMTNGYLILTLVDKYQAYRERKEPFSHQDAIQKLKEEVEASERPKNIKRGYRKAIDILEGLEKDLEKIIRG